MAPVASTMALSHVEGVSDSARARELYKYYQPNAPINQDTCFPIPPPQSTSPSDEIEQPSDVNIRSSVTSSKISSPDTALTAFCQLTTWRTGAQRAMISVIDAETQYFIAESTRTVDLVDNTKHAPGDDIWMGCGSVTKAGRLCERTIAVAPQKAGSYPCFVVNDLSQDERFNTLPFVTGPPYLKFYAGVPLITKRGIPIGSLFVVDDRIGHGISDEKIHFMGTMATTIMRHMEMVREVEEHRRGMKMSRALASFVEGRSELAEAEANAEDTEGTKVAGQFEPESGIIRTKSRGSTRGSVKGSTRGSYTSAIGPMPSSDRKEKEYSAALSKTEQAIMTAHAHLTESPVARPDLEATSQPASFGGTSISVSSPHGTYDQGLTPGADELSEASSMKLLFSRSANLIREAFEVDGGAVFYDAQTGFSSNINHPRPGDPTLPEDSLTESAADSHTSGDEIYSPMEPNSDGEPRPHAPKNRRSSSPTLTDGTFSRTTGDGHKLVEILGFSTPEAASIHGESLPGPQSFSPFSEKALHILLRRYPRGKLWTFDSDGTISSSSEEEGLKTLSHDPEKRSKDIHKRRAQSKKTKADALFLSKQFPGARQILFVPLWDASRARWLSGCFAWSTEPTRILSRQNELAFLTAFGNSVMAEWARIDTEIADQKKSDFIGSISHELRSPLHGILASAEFLAETSSGWSKGLVETIDSCGRTLLDTINHILDYSKINHFEKNWRRSKRSERRPRHGSAASVGGLALRRSDLPMLSLYQNIDISVLCEEVVESVFAGHVFQNVTAQSFDMVPGTRGKMSDASRSSSDDMLDTRQVHHSGVAVILDIDAQNYHFNTQPGALRRLVMNLLGNALKYTSHGYVCIKLEASEMEDYHNSPIGSTASENVSRSLVTLTVTDTGKGISAEFLRSKLFTPFAQENSLSSGTGLGLSIVRKIVSLLEGDITIDSEVGRGTLVRVTLPLLRDMPGTAGSAGSASTNRSLIAQTRDTDQSITELRTRIIGQNVSLHGFDLDTPDPVHRDMARLLKASVATFLRKWYGMTVVPLGERANIIICNETSPEDLQSLVLQIPRRKGNPSIVVLCAHDTRFNHTPHLESARCNISYVAKPVGPLKLAKAITSCLDGVPPSTTPGTDSVLSHSHGHSPESSDLSATFDSLSMTPRGGEFLDNTRMASDSLNARKALESPTPKTLVEKTQEFPFPSPPPAVNEVPELPHGKSMPSTQDSLKPFSGTNNPTASKTLTKMEKATQNHNAHPPTKIESPTLLLVDDNHINLKLLSTYLNRRNFAIVHQAQNGLEAVKMFDGRREGYDIIFMDITMPILDGFGATNQIRSIEEARRKKYNGALLQEGPAPLNLEAAGLLPNGKGGKGVEVGGKAALIIAFTGRSSMEDQAEAVRVGIDLFMTKPVAFKEVGKIIDNWMANRERGEERN